MSARGKIVCVSGPAAGRELEIEREIVVGRVEVADERVRGTHPPRVGHELPQALDVPLRQPQHHQRPAVVAGRGEEDLGLAEQQSLLLGLVADEQHRDVGPDEPRLARSALGVGPDEPLVGHPEVEAVALDLRHIRQGER